MTRQSTRLLLLFAALAIVPAISIAEVSTDRADDAVGTLTLATVGDDSDPIGIWLQYRVLGPGQVLNSSGHLRDDGRPDIVYASQSDGLNPIGRPLAIWAYNAGSDHDIAFAEWSGGAWGPTQFLTFNSANDRDPRLFAAPNGELHAVWWTDGIVDRIHWSSRPPGSTVWDTPVEVVSGGRRPTVAVFAGALRIAYERNSLVGGMAQDVVLVYRESGGGFVEEFAASTTRVEPLDAVLHGTAAKLWLDWKDADQLFGCAERGAAAWGPVGFVSWTDPSWVGVEETRRVVRGFVLGN